MKKAIILQVLTVILFISCGKDVKSLEQGTFSYVMKINGFSAGSARISRIDRDGMYITETTMTLKAGNIENSSFQRVTETHDYKPVKLEILNTMSDSHTGKNEVIKKTADFSGSKVSLDSNGYKTEVNLTGTFYLDGNFFDNELLKKKFKKGSVVKARIYEPSVETDKTILVIFKVLGDEKIRIGDKDVDVVHITQKVEMLKSIDWYISRDGVTQKAVIKMLNNIFELELKNR